MAGIHFGCSDGPGTHWTAWCLLLQAGYRRKQKSSQFSESKRYADSSILIVKLQESIISEHSRLCKIGPKSAFSNYMTPKAKKREAATPFSFAKLIFRPREKWMGCKSDIPAAKNNSKSIPRQSCSNSVVFLRKIAIVLHQQSSSITI